MTYDTIKLVGYFVIASGFAICAAWAIGCELMESPLMPIPRIFITIVTGLAVFSTVLNWFIQGVVR